MIIQCIFDFLFAGCWLLLNPSPEGVLSWAFVLHRCVCVFICICYCKSISNCCWVSDCICCCPLLSPSPAWEVLFWVFVQLRGICLSVVFCTFQGQSTHFIPLIVSEKAKDTKAQPFLFQVLLNIISKSEKVTSDLTATDAEVKTPLNGDQKNQLPPLPLMRT